MNTHSIITSDRKSISGRASLMLMWLLGVPLPIIALIWMFHG